MPKPYTYPRFQNLARDSSTAPIQIGSGFITTDISSVPNTSPLTLTGDIQIITVPENAVEFVVAPSVNLNVSELADLSTYDIVIATTKEAIPCSEMDYIYIQGISSGTANFRFTIV